ncbi:MAG: tRNA lysidine(34) synthetase TilS [Betaproteobacteria bacterium]|nr:tRNA lysidine(34) synthetase TilS [Betaproteobacteria bacterium]
MGDSTTPKPPEAAGASTSAPPSPPWAGASWTAYTPALPLAVAFSGGADSTAMLLACHARWPGQVHALHINHGLQAAAAEFEAHCKHLCQQLGVPLWCDRVHIDLHKGDSLEQAARLARYEALARLAGQAGVQQGSVVVAHHADDQVETVLLALLRGAGLPGLAAMPERFERHGVRFDRPWLHVHAQDIRSWLRSTGQAWVEDPSNDQLAHTRNRIRHALAPVLDAHFPAHRQTLARSARHAAQAQGLLREVGEQDLKACGLPPRIKDLQALSPARLANALRVWLKGLGLRVNTAQLDELMSQVQACTTQGHHIELKVGEGRVVRQAEVLVGYNLPLSTGRK